jgi:hypothetical protein
MCRFPWEERIGVKDEKKRKEKGLSVIRDFI